MRSVGSRLLMFWSQPGQGGRNPREACIAARAIKPHRADTAFLGLGRREMAEKREG
jgi:hypothetical protein